MKSTEDPASPLSGASSGPTSRSSTASSSTRKTLRARFACRTRSCSASVRITTGNDGEFHADRCPTHNHPDHSEYVAALRHIQRLRDEARARTNRHVPTATVCGDVRVETKTTRRRSVDTRLVRRYRKRGNAPATPGEIESFPFLEQNAAYVSPDKTIIVFCREWGVRVASAVKRICVDGTFRSAPKTHYQLLTFHALCSNGSSFLIVHSLMSDKRYESYLVVLRQIEAKAQAVGIGSVFRRKDLVVSVDFESALIKALRKFGVALHGCYFHLCQAVWRFVKNHSMSSRYNKEALFRKRIRSLTALAFFPPEEIPRHFKTMKALVRGDEQLRCVYEYFEKTWVDGFGVELIAQHGEVFRTNNSAESFHNSLRLIFHAPHPNFYDFVEKLSGIMDRAENEFNVERANPKRIRTKALAIGAKVTQLIEIFNANDVLTLELPDLLDRIGSIVAEACDFEARFEDGCDSVFEPVDADFCAQAEVPMELAEDESTLGLC